MTRILWAGFILGTITLILHLPPALGLQGGFGVDALLYYPPATAVILSAVTLILIFPPLGRKVFHRIFTASSGLPAVPAWAYGLAAACLFWLVRAATPLWGDGLDRIEALPAGLSAAIRGQPSPLDIIIHWLVYQALVPFTFKGFFPASIFESETATAAFTYAIVSCAAGGIYVGLNVHLARKVFTDITSRCLFVGGMISLGGMALFAGYPENYSLLVALIPLWLLSVFGIKEDKFKAWWFVGLMIIMTGLHFFAFLLVPPGLIHLYRTGKWRPGRIQTAFVILICGLFLGLMFSILQSHYRGVTAIFVAPKNWFSGGHLMDFFQSQILASPAIIVMTGLLLLSRKPRMGQEEKILFSSSIIMIVFWFFLRPVIGAPFDWDLFSIPAFIYTPFLIVRLGKKLSESPALPYLAGLIMVISLFHTLPWLFLHSSEEKSVSRFEDRLELEVERNRWSAGWGYYKLGKYFRQKGEIEEAFSAYESSIAANPKYSVLHEKIGLEMLAIGRLDLATSRLEDAHKLNPTNPMIKMELVEIKLLYAGQLSKHGKAAEAEKEFLDVLEIAPKNMTALRELIHLYRYQLRKPEAAREMEERLKRMGHDEE